MQELEFESELITEDKCDYSEVEGKSTYLYLFFMLMFQTLFRISDNALNVLFTFLALFLEKLGKLFECAKLENFASKLSIVQE